MEVELHNRAMKYIQERPLSDEQLEVLKTVIGQCYDPEDEDHCSRFLERLLEVVNEVVADNAFGLYHLPDAIDKVIELRAEAEEKEFEGMVEKYGKYMTPLAALEAALQPD